MRPFLALLAAWMLAALPDCGDNPSAPPTPKIVLTDNPLATALDSLVDRAVQEYASKPSTAGFGLALVENGAVHLYDYGETRLGNGTLPDSNTVYEIGSITKTFTAAALLVWLQERGTSIDTPVEGFLPASASPGLQRNGAKATLKQLLNHTSGLPRLPQDLGSQPGFSADNPYRGYDSTRVLVYIAGHAPVYTPGTPPAADGIFNAYSNLAYGLAGIVLERNLNLSLETILAGRICAPLGMTATTIALPAARLAAAHDARGRVVSYWDLAGFAGAGALHSTLHDMVLYARAQLGQIGPALQPVFDLCHTPTVVVDGKDVFGLGWEFHYLSTGKRITVKDGGTGGFTSFIALDAPAGKAAVMLFNNSIDSGGAASFVAVLEAFF